MVRMTRAAPLRIIRPKTKANREIFDGCEGKAIKIGKNDMTHVDTTDKNGNSVKKCFSRKTLEVKASILNWVVGKQSGGYP